MKQIVYEHIGCALEPCVRQLERVQIKTPSMLRLTAPCTWTCSVGPEAVSSDGSRRWWRRVAAGAGRRRQWAGAPPAAAHAGVPGKRLCPGFGFVFPMNLLLLCI